ncbi:uncharacterized protein [Garra rufa]|uniref:uncharacterized protein n=1 Tax=Garra rufa TaxID=137080 RepID=UPI003CCE8C0D
MLSLEQILKTTSQYERAHHRNIKGQRTESPESRQIIKEIAYSKVYETLAALVSEVRELRLEVQGFMRRELSLSPPLPLSLPLKDLTEFEEAERILQSKDARQIMVGRFAIVGGASVEGRIRRMLTCALTNELASQMNWAGKKLKEEHKRKTAFKDTNLRMCMYDALKQQLKAGKKRRPQSLSLLQLFRNGFVMPQNGWGELLVVENHKFRRSLNTFQSIYRVLY